MRGIFIGLMLLLVPALGMAQSGFQPRDENEADYPDHPGRAESFGFCGSCHGFRIVAVQGMTRTQWDVSLTWMSQRHNMPDLDKADRDLILEYLSKAYPPRLSPAGRPDWRAPFAPQ